MTAIQNPKHKTWSAKSLSPLPSPLSPLPSPPRRVVVGCVGHLGDLRADRRGVRRLDPTCPAERKDAQRIDQVSDPPKQLLQQALMQVLHGPTTNPTTGIPNPASVMGAHSLLEDMYGNNWAQGTIGSAAVVTGFRQLINITPSGITTTEVARRGGCVLTITSPTTSPSYGQSTRIVALNLNATPITLQVMAFPDGSVPNTGDRFVVNGVPFSGAGFGFTLDANGHWVPNPADPTLALKPNDPANRNPPGGANPDYTAADFQHVLLAARVPNANAVGGIQTLPSLHRWDLIQYWGAKQSTPNQFSVSNLQTIMMRPIGGTASLQGITISDPGNIPHPDFDGSNPKFNPVWDGRVVLDGTGMPLNPQPYAWDVDNDGDGVADSIWVDLGMPVRQTTDGLCTSRCSRSSASIHGRLNLNAHGSLAQARHQRDDFTR